MGERPRLGRDKVRFVFDEVDIHYVRLASWFKFWEPKNDNSDPQEIDWAGFAAHEGIIAEHDFPFARWMTQRGLALGDQSSLSLSIARGPKRSAFRR